VSNEYKLTAADEDEDDSLTRMNTEVAILKSGSLMATVAREMDLANNPAFLGAKGVVAHRSPDDPKVMASVVDTLLGNLSVTLVQRTEIIRISYSSLDPKLSADIVNKVISDYIQRSYRTPVERTKTVSQYLSSQLDELKSEVERSQQQLMELQRKLGVLGFNSDISHSNSDPANNQLQSSLEDLLKAEGAAKIARIDAESRYRMIAGMDPSTIAGSIETTPGTAPAELNILRGQLATSKAEYAAMASTLGPNHPQTITARARIDELTKAINLEQTRMEIQAKQTYLAAKATEDKTEQELEAKKTEAYQQGGDVVQEELVQREFEQNRTLYDGLQQRLRTAEVQAGLEALEVDVVDAALPPITPTLRSPVTVILSTVVVFLLGAIVIVFILEGMDTSLHNIQQIEAVMEMPSLAIIPQAKRVTAEQATTLTTAERNINVLNQPKSQFTEAFRSLRTALLLTQSGEPPKLILFTSAMPSEGKTTVASNLACILSQSGSSVLLLDADLRRSNIHHRFGIPGKLGLTTVLAGTSTLQETIQHIAEAPNLDVLPSGPVPPFPTEMLSSEAMHRLLEQLESMYTYVVIDSPPVLSVTDGVILGRLVDAVVLVVRHGKSSKNVMHRARNLLTRSGAPVAGLVLNAVDVNSPEYYGYYGYMGYSYGTIDADSWKSRASSTGKTDAEERGGR
jgi:capsular exopolysaccharide synthesis family protein